ncbi:hypothetical protein DF185_04320 [Marinifilum breve]|uniref:Uncharacterized protein n=1 Tax=Marinifilum breve TaxID=2184082 RepID=A0A2V4A3F5_9BACT|nr:DUF6155 family protein [Marinifilum breve]PXY01880.1 hypothetical protein DF185_04320 [Marinifilum breve]
MSKKDLKEYIHQLTKEQLQDQILDLYTRFKDVKEFYDFAFNPKENKLMEECKFKISKEYFPVSGRKAKMRRSVAQNYIRHFKRLGVDSSLIADIMLYNIEIAQTYTSEQYIKQESFYKSMLKSFQEAVKYIRDNSLDQEFKSRLNKVVDESIDQNWMNSKGFMMAYK